MDAHCQQTILKERNFTNISTQTEVSLTQPSQGIKEKECRILAYTNDEKGVKEVDFNESNDILKRRLNPTTKEDFENLFDEVEQWRDIQLRDVESKKDSLADNGKYEREIVLNKETKLLKKIESLKKQVLRKSSERKLRDDLSVLGGPKIWKMKNGEEIIVETKETKYASKLVDMYTQLSLFGNQDVTKRLEVLGKAKLMLENVSPTPISKEAIDLINREYEFLNRCMYKSLKGLRERLLNLFLQVLEHEAGVTLGKGRK